ncbi:GNAT family N-acetyltransferase [Paucisalibacillus globulus]|uniref:GNAT family N-acetyltransferase n=1 Tax=Paucisalibacillus globulus TaxID=351095 RepID=UPI0003FA5D6A|nr:GNAT family N-acetyltransferase [Paucisalibacillus globulus]
MDLIILRTKKEEASKLLVIQKKAFKDDLEKYQDHESSPVNEPIERLRMKIELFFHYTIWLNDEIIGGIDVRDLGDGKYRLNRIFISPDFQGLGLGTRIMQVMESEFSQAKEWSLDTPHLNSKNHHFYEKLGYIKVGEHVITEKLRLVDYVKTIYNG